MGTIPLVQYRQKGILEVIQVLGNGDYLVQNAGDPSTTQIIPKVFFELTYEQII